MTPESRENLQSVLRCAEDLAEVQEAVAREQVIRTAMADTGESREVVTEMLDAQVSMGQEAVLDLTDGEPTTLKDGLARYIAALDRFPNGMHPDTVAVELTALLEYPWSAEEATIVLHGDGVELYIGEGDERDMQIRIGDNKHLVATINWEEAGSAGQRVAIEVARAVHRAVLNRVIADREHIVQLNRVERIKLVDFLNKPSGAWSDDHRLSVNAVEGGGVLIRTQPYRYQRPGSALVADVDRRAQRDAVVKSLSEQDHV